MITQLGKDIYNAQYRVLDHRVFVNGEIEEFLNNFETQRNDSEIESLFKVTETVGALKYEISDKCINLGAANLTEISTELKSLLEKVDNLVNDLQKPQEPSETLKEARLERIRRKEDINKQIEHNYQRVENSFAVKEEEIAELYSDLQLKLNIPK
ncbi:biogenesis of lysosome-related organelles complex 1 subunit 5 [Lucilia cuprina]|uniref:biogenesis of lysosome-related organelles complex 1 subunit 5 n=1 Tax=Lucilia cuprina TaxID=7375 RepID=UPI000C718DF4|nr:biogenesis of lysosome-related organelles complex 1 subunit 5 [Lucilia cuprina]